MAARATRAAAPISTGASAASKDRGTQAQQGERKKEKKRGCQAEPMLGSAGTIRIKGGST